MLSLGCISSNNERSIGFRFFQGSFKIHKLIEEFRVGDRLFSNLKCGGDDVVLVTELVEDMNQEVFFINWTLY